jgi:GWxTD domain-containing protein
MIWSRFRWSLLAVVIVSTLRYGTAKPSQGALAPKYQKWLVEDVHWLISAQEEREFLKLTTDEQRDHFVVRFWEQRNPDLGSKENTFKEEHYRRLAFSNQNFGANAPGWKTDRGHVYVVYGPPDSVLKHPSSGANPSDELWSYRHMPGADGDVTLKFIDRCACGEYVLVSDLPNTDKKNVR